MRLLAAFALVSLVGCGILIGSEPDESPASPSDTPTVSTDGAVPADGATTTLGDAGNEAGDADADAKPLPVTPDPTHLAVGVSTQLFAPNNGGGQAAADAICANDFDGRFVAWLSKDDGTYLPDRLPNGASWWNGADLIFANKGDLGTGPVTPLPGTGHVWTGTSYSGYPMQTCANWTNSDAGGRPIGTVGALGATGTAWTQDMSSSEDCATPLKIICFQKQ